MLEGEQNLIRSARKGNASAFGALYDHYIAQIYRFIYLRVSGREEAEDLTHEVFLSAWRNIPSYKHKGFPFSSWLYQIARNKVIDHFRTRKTTFPIEEVIERDLDIPALLNTEEDLDIVLDLEKIRLAMQSLTEEQQSIIIMRFVEDMAPKEIAEVLGKSEGSVRLMQHRAINNLKAILRKTKERGPENSNLV